MIATRDSVLAMGHPGGKPPQTCKPSTCCFAIMAPVETIGGLVGWVRASVWRVRLLVVTGYALLATLFTWPLPLHMSEQTVLARGGDFYLNIWNMWWTKFSLLTLHQHPFYTDYLHYPVGQSLLYHDGDTLNGVLSIPLQGLFGLLAAFNLMRLAHLVFSGVAAYALCRVLGLPRPAAWIGGALYLMCPVTSNAFDLGQLDIISTGWIPLYILCLIKGLGNRALGLPPGRWWWLVGAAFAVAAAALASWYFSIALMLFTLLYVSWELAATWLLSKRAQSVSDEPMMTNEARSSHPLLATRIIGRAAIVGVGAGVLLSPLIIAVAQENATGATYIASPLRTIITSSADLLAPFLPLPAHYNDPTINPFGGTVALGWTVIGLAVIALVLRRRVQSSKFKVQSSRSGNSFEPGTLNFEYSRGHLYFWLVVAVAFVVLALGPHLLIGGKDTGIPMPYLLLNKIPLLGAARVPMRLIVIVSLAMSVLAAYGLVALWEMVRATSARASLFAIVGLLVVLEFFAIPRTLITPTVHPFFESIAANGADGAHEAVLELPVVPRTAPSMLNQTVHQHPIMSAYTARKYPYPWFDATLGVSHLAKADPKSLTREDIITPAVGDSALTSLDYYGVRYVVIYVSGDDELDGRTTKTADALFGAHNIEPVMHDAELTVYKVPPQPRTGPLVGLGSGWYAVEQSGERRWRWTDGHALVQLTNPTTTQMATRLRLAAYSLGQPRTLLVLLDGTEAGTQVIHGHPSQEVSIEFRLEPGEHWMELRSVEPPEVVPGDERLLSLGFERLVVERR
jgi:hypothetical protein